MNELFSALSKAQATMHKATLSSENPFFKTKYASLAEIIRASRPALCENGLCVTQILKTNAEDSSTFLVSILGHSSGQFIESVIKVAPQKQDVQSLGSYISYLKRYAYTALVGVVVSDDSDDDGESSVERSHGAPRTNNRVEQKGPEPVDLNETINKDQLSILEDELNENIDLTGTILKAYQITSLTQLPKGRFMQVISRIREINNLKGKNNS